MRPIMLCLGLTASLVLAPQSGFPANHREAPITALDHKADITDIYAFVSYGQNQAPGTPPKKVTLILGVDPLLEPGNGPTLFPFDPAILYELRIDNNRDAIADVIFQFQFQTEYQLPNVFTAVAGFSDMGLVAPGVPPRITDFQNPGLNLRQTYRVTMVRGTTESRAPEFGRLSVFRGSWKRGSAHHELRGSLQQGHLPSRQRGLPLRRHDRRRVLD